MKNNDLRSIFNDRMYTIKIESTDGNSYILNISSNKVDIYNNLHIDNVDVEIKGTNEVLLSVLTGKNRLQRLYKQKKLSVKGAITAILKIETALYLSYCESCFQ